MARFLFEEKIVEESMTFTTLAGPIQASITAGGARVQLTDAAQPVRKAGLFAADTPFSGHHLDTGVPHLVIRVDDVEAISITEWGRALRNHPDFQPAGTNVDFYADMPDGVLKVRTYERGVEDETLACGTGATATALVAATAGKASPITVETRSATRLTISFTQTPDGFTDIFLEGPAHTVYRGTTELT
jgi:diaminopimelate epimerase